jgi:1-aminocyclopropane-1-carboxylate deaminase/D-cysteine desulfhydrase-like pyridoxal-dependent ACC family enzyme
MADSTQRSSSTRSKSSSTPKGRGGKTSGSKRPSSSRSAATSNRSRASRTTAGSSSRAKSRRSGSRSTASKNGRSSTGGGSRSASSSAGNGVVHNVTETVGSAASKAKAPLVAGGAAAAGLLGGLVLGSRVLTPRKKVLGIPIPRKGLDFKPVAKEVHKAGKQLGRLTDEMAQARKQAKKVGDALS